MKQSGGVSKKLLKECSVIARKSAPPSLELLLMVFLSLKFNKGVIGMSTKNIHEKVFLESDNLMKICAKNDEEQCFLSVLNEERAGEDPKKKNYGTK